MHPQNWCNPTKPWNKSKRCIHAFDWFLEYTSSAWCTKLRTVSILLLISVGHWIKKNADLLEDTPIICLLIILLQYYCNNCITCMFLRFLDRSPCIFNTSILLWASLLFVSGWHYRLVYADFFCQIWHLNTLWCLCCGFVIFSPNLTWSSLSLQLHLWLS